MAHTADRRILPGSVVLVTGASRGIGRACADELARRGYRVYGTSRDPAPAGEIAFRLLRMDAGDDESVNRAVRTVLDAEGRIDALVNNAGVSLVGAVEETRPDELLDHLNVNLLGYHRLWRAVLPSMRESGRGRLVTISSIAAQIAVPFQGGYSAGKAAVEALAEALAYEVRPYGLDVVIVEPGNIATTIAQSRRVTDAARAKSAYPQTTSLLETIASEEHAGSDPQVVARLVAKVLAARRPRLRFSAGPVSERLAPWVKRLLPNRVIRALVRSHYAG